jgi:hypothetical protein
VQPRRPAGDPVRAATILRLPGIWIGPLVITSVLIAAIAVIYIGSVINPTGHLHGLPVTSSSVDGALGYATTEIGPRWHQRTPVAIDRKQTLLVKLAIVAAASTILTGILLLVAAGALGMHAPHVGHLWLLLTLAAMMIAAGTRALIVITAEVVFWPAVGLIVTSWYDRKRLYRLAPVLLAYVEQAVDRRPRG